MEVIGYICCPNKDITAELIFDLLVEARKPGRQIFYFSSTEFGTYEGIARDCTAVVESDYSDDFTRAAALAWVKTKAEELEI